MKNTILFIFVSIVWLSCTMNQQENTIANDRFSMELIQLKDYFHIPMSVLAYGDVIYSLFALASLKNHTFDIGDMTLIEDESPLQNLESRITRDNCPFLLKKLIAQSVAESFLGQFDPTRSERSKNILEQIFRHFPDDTHYGEVTLMHHLSFLKAMALHQGEDSFVYFDRQLRDIGLEQIAIDNDTPYANYYLPNYYQEKTTPIV
ncbi:MAG: hypothetical protein IPL46_30150 [Saprospiraceae bacterium]|nr:hypothetical protein [Saprospiraceae bacterium]